MKYVRVNPGMPRGGYVLVSDDAKGEEIKREAKRQGVIPDDNDPGVLAGHTCNGASRVIGDAEVSRWSDFSLDSIFDNA